VKESGKDKEKTEKKGKDTPKTAREKPDKGRGTA
jgi:hypothetical protein